MDRGTLPTALQEVYRYVLDSGIIIETFGGKTGKFREITVKVFPPPQNSNVLVVAELYEL